MLGSSRRAHLKRQEVPGEAVGRRRGIKKKEQARENWYHRILVFVICTNVASTIDFQG